MAIGEAIRRWRSGYGRLWLPRSQEEARRQILNDDDSEAFERSGREAAEALAAHFGPGDTVLDLGCGVGRVARYAAPRCRTLWAVDVSPLMLHYARQRMVGTTNVRYARSRGTTVPDIPTGAIDFAYSLLTLQHVEREDAFLLLRELGRVVRPGGMIHVTFPNLLSDTYLAAFVAYAEEGRSSNRARARFYTPQEVERILPAAGLLVSEIDAGTEIAVRCTVPA
jgi:ubiquinone/menaquinone biosynthesis C-methylase UbiE